MLGFKRREKNSQNTLLLNDTVTEVLEVSMHLTRSLSLIVLLTSVVWTSTFTGCPQQSNFTSESSALESLECRNDYRTHICCSWRENPSIPLSLFHMDPDNYRVAPCVRTRRPFQNPPGPERVFCRYNTSLFAIGFDDVFFFHTPHSPGVFRTFKLTKYNDTKWIFNQLDDTSSPSYSSPDGLKSLPTSDLFRHHDQHHTEIDMKHETGKDEQDGKNLTESTKDVEDKMNKNETEGSGILFDRPTLMSNYSDELPGPFNLRCEYHDGNNVSCSWELKTILTQFISYTLFYRTHSSALTKWCCVEKVEVMNMGGLLRIVGVFNIFEPGVLQVQLTPTPVTRVIHAYKHIQPACPTGLSVELNGEDWILNWTLPKYRTVRLTTHLEYWSVLTPEDVKIITLSNPVTVFSIPERTLMGSSEYRARVRCNVSTHRHPGQRYAGYPSEWTNHVSWTTRPEPFTPRLVAFFLYFLIATLSAAVSVVVFFILIVMHRRLKDWNASLPSPVHSKVFECPQRDLLPSCRELKDPDISSAQIVGVSPLLPSFDSECTTAVDGNNHGTQTKQNQVILHVDDPCLVCTQSAFGNVMKMNLTQCYSTFQPHTTYDAVLPCSEGYVQNPATYLQEACHLDAEINDGYMNCLDRDLISNQGRKNTCLLHTQESFFLK